MRAWPAQSTGCVGSGALYPEKCGDERMRCGEPLRRVGALYPEKCGDGGLMLFNVTPVIRGLDRFSRSLSCRS